MVWIIAVSTVVLAGNDCNSTSLYNCNITSNITLVPGDYAINKTVLLKNNNTFLDCQGSTLRGLGSESSIALNVKSMGSGGFNIPGVSVRNCTITNVSTGILVNRAFNLSLRGNTFIDVPTGILLDGIRDNFSSEITQNVFVNSTLGLGSGEFQLVPGSFNLTKIWNNTFSYLGVTYLGTPDPSVFCNKGFGNTYTFGATGPTCTCMIPIPYLKITRDTVFCPGTYLASFMEIGSQAQPSTVILQCNGTVLKGNITLPENPSALPGIYVVEGTVRNCIFTNFTEGIDTLDGHIIGNTFFQNKGGIAFFSELGSIDIRFNNFLDNIEADVLVPPGNFVNYTLPYNWWGTTDIDEIHRNITDCVENEEDVGCIDVLPILTQGPGQRQFDLSVADSGISFKPSPNGTLVVAEVFNKGSVELPFAETSFLVSRGGLFSERSSVLLENLPPNSSTNASLVFSLSKGDKIIIVADPNNEARDDNRDNNRAEKQFLGLKKYFIAADVPPTRANQEILDFVKENLRDGILVEDENDADFKILIARHNPLIVWHFQTVEERGWGFMGGGIKHKDTFCDKPYCAIVGNFDVNGKKEIYIEGNDVDGFVAAAKRFIKEQDVLKEGKKEIFVGQDDIGGISVFDFLHNANNKKHYKEDSNEFGSIVRDALNENMVEETQINTTADGVTLRLLHLQPAFSKNLKEFKDTVQLPVVLARGLWSNLNSWQGFGAELASSEARDTWLIEITGGPGTDCAGKAVDDCPDYTYDNITDRYVPALLNKVLNETNKTKLQYVGFSNGCRSALSSLEKGSFDPAKVDTFVGVGCPGNFSGDSLFASCLKQFGEQILNDLGGEGIKHLTQKEFGKKLGELSSSSSLGCYLLSKFLGEGEGKISKNLAKGYSNFISNNSETQPGESLSIDKFSMMYGIAKFQFQKDNDLVVTEKDALGISNGIISGTKVLKSVSQRHDKLPDSEEVKDYIVKEVMKN